MHLVLLLAPFVEPHSAVSPSRIFVSHRPYVLRAFRRRSIPFQGFLNSIPRQFGRLSISMKWKLKSCLIGFVTVAVAQLEMCIKRLVLEAFFPEFVP